MTAFGAACKPTVVINRFVAPEEWAKVRHIKLSGPVIVLNPFVEQPKALENSPISYRKITPRPIRPQIIYPAKLK
jgi:hypothetical protein